jgi:membrane protein DedA with SNARE-associated domain
MPHLPIEEWLTFLRSLYEQYGYPIVFGSSFAENTAVFGLILPGNSLVLLGAYYARLGVLNLGLVILLATLGTIVGYHVDFLFGRFVMAHVIKYLSATRLGQRLRLAGRMRMAHMLLAKHGGKAILLSHLTGHIRSFVAISAGMIRMPYLTFLLFEVIAATIWNTLYALLGYSIALNIDQLAALIQQAGLLIFAALVVIYVLWRLVKSRLERRLRVERQERLKRKRQEKMQP